MADDQSTPTIDLAAYVKSRFASDGAEVVGPGSDPGTIQIKTPAKRDSTNTYYLNGTGLPDYTTVDQNKILADGGADPTKVKVQLGSINQPLSENPLGFVDRVKFALAGENENKQKLLEDSFGKDHAAFNAKTGQFMVRKDNAIYNVTNPGFLAGAVADAPVILAATIGGIAGGIGGTLIEPGGGTAIGAEEGATYGAVAGNILGGAIGTGLGRLGTIEAAQAAGIRDKVDWDTANKELAKEMMWSTAFGAAPYALGKVGLIGEAATGKALSKLDDVIANPDVRGTYAKIIGSMVDEDPSHIATAMNNPEEWTSSQKLSSKWENQRIANSGTGIAPEAGEINPIKLKMANLAQTVIDRGWRQTKADYGQFINAPETKAAMSEARVNMSDLSVESGGQPVDIQQHLSDLKDAIGDSIPSDSNVLKKTLADLNEARGGSGAKYDYATGKMNSGRVSDISYDDAKQLKDRVTNILSSQGAFDKPAMQVSSQTQRALTMYSQALDTNMSNGLSAVDKSVGQGMLDANAQYATRKMQYESIGGRKAFEPGNIDTTLAKLGGQKGERLRQSLTDFLGDVDSSNVKDTMKQIDIYNSVLHTSKLFQGDSLYRSALNAAGKSAAKLTPTMVGTMQRLGQTVGFISRQPEELRKQIFNNPAILNTLLQSYAQSFQIEAQTKDQLTTSALQGTAPNGQ